MDALMKMFLTTIAFSVSLGTCGAELKLGQPETIATINQKDGVRAVIEPAEDEEGAVVISIEMEPKNEFLKSPKQASYVLTLIDEGGQLLVNLPADGFKTLHKSPVVRKGFYRLQFTVREALLKNSYLIFYDDDEGFSPKRTKIRYVHFSAVPDDPPGKPDLKK